MADEPKQPEKEAEKPVEEPAPEAKPEGHSEEKRKTFVTQPENAVASDAPVFQK